MSDLTVYKQIEKIEKLLSKLKLVIEKKVVPVKPNSISKCKSKSDLEKFTTTELKAWIKENKIDIKKLSEKHKANFIKLVWDAIMNSRIVESESESESEYSSESESESESDYSSESD